jgi:glycosyltransferase involved in cell wall biosynthesis
VTLLALLQARDEARYLPGWLENVAAAVDGIIALDDGSRDDTALLLRAHPKVIEVISNPPGGPWNERGNHLALIKAARAHGGDWVLAIDADERLEQRFAGAAPQLLAEAHGRGLEAYSLQLRELWNDRRHYRVDGIWGGKARYRLFRNRREHTKFDPRPLHRYWMPLEIVSRIATVGAHLDLNLYHLRTIRSEERRARHARYLALDPDGRYQPQGYDYLIDETAMQLVEIPPERDFFPADDPAAGG